MGQRPMRIVNGQPHDDYFVQKMVVEDARHLSRLELFIPLARAKTVLHVGNVDWPITDPTNSLHLQLAQVASRIDGVDPNQDGAEAVQVANGDQFQDWEHLRGRSYDLIIVPEVVEHVDSFRELFADLDSITGPLIITAPCAWACQSFFEKRGELWIEVVHPDHNCWFTPYTLKNMVEKHGRRRVSSLHWINRMSIAAIAS